jgi:hypothetical protein
VILQTKKDWPATDSAPLLVFTQLIALCNENIDVKFSADDAFLEKPSAFYYLAFQPFDFERT